MLFNATEEYIKGSDNFPELFLYAFLLVLGYAVKQLFQVISSITINASVYETVNQLSYQKLYKKCSELPLISYEDPKIIDCKTRAAKCIDREIISQLYMSVISIIMGVIGVISVIAVLLSYSIWFALIGILSVSPYFIARFLRGKEFYRLKRSQVKKERYKDYLWTLFTNKRSAKEMRVMGFGEYILKKWTKYRDEVNEETWNLVKKDAQSLFWCDIIRITGYGICLVLSFFLTIVGYISIGVFSACISAFSSMQNQTKLFLTEMGNISEKINYAKDYFDFIDAVFQEDDGDKEIRSIDNILLKNIYFSYPNTDRIAIDNLNFEIKKGETIALVGENGSGKTTLVKLLLRMYPINKGNIYINGIDAKNVNRQSYYKKVSIISQNFMKYYMSLRENIAISDLKKFDNDNLIKKVIKDTENDFINNISIDNLLGVEFGGLELSDGQWQKIAIARGNFKESELIIMDEPTSAIDPVAESEILKRFLQIARGKTAIIVSHRTGICTLADKIVVMKDGHIVEVGSHEKLLDYGNEYAKLFNAQRQWYV